MLDEKKIYSAIRKRFDKNIMVVGIDGLGGAGKSTISEKICAYRPLIF